MKTLLPKNTTRQGFTLIELLVVIAIIAVLAVMGFAAFRGFTGRGNDARRAADIKAIGDALESARAGAQATNYLALATSQFASGAIPIDPIGGAIGNANHQGYCISSANSGNLGSAPGAWTWSAATHCPVASPGVGAAGAAFVDVAVGVPSGGNTAIWMVCGAQGDNTSMSANTVICRNSAQ